MGLSVVIPPACLPVHLDALKPHVTQDMDDDDASLMVYLAAACRYVEERLCRTLVATRLKHSCLSTPTDLIPLLRPPLIGVVSVNYTDSAGDAQTVTDYRVDADSYIPNLWPAVDDVWPTCQSGPGAFSVTYDAGYLAPITANASTDVLTVAGRTLEDGAAVVLSNSGGSLPGGLEARTVYYVRDVSGQTFKVSATDGGSAIDLTSVGSGANFVGEMPEQITHAILLHAAESYKNRELTAEGAVATLPMTVGLLIDPLRAARYV